MANHKIEPNRETLHGYFPRDLPPVLTIESGDSVVYSTLDAAWNLIDQARPINIKKSVKFEPLDSKKHPGHALCKPIASESAEPGMVLEIKIRAILPGKWGWSSAGGV